MLAGSAAVVSVNTGVMHLAAALGVPTVSLDGPTAPQRWGPIGPRTVSVRPAQADCGFIHLGPEYDPRYADCMKRITVAQVVAAMHGLMERVAGGG